MGAECLGERFVDSELDPNVNGNRLGADSSSIAITSHSHLPAGRGATGPT